MKFFENVPKVKYEGSKSTNPFAFKYYNPEAVIAGKKNEGSPEIRDVLVAHHDGDRARPVRFGDDEPDI